MHSIAHHLHFLFHSTSRADFCALAKMNDGRDLLPRLLKASEDGAGGALTAQHYTDMSTAMAAYLADPSPEASLDCGGDMRLIRQAYYSASYIGCCPLFTHLAIFERVGNSIHLWSFS